MHLLAAQAGILQQEGEAIDLAQAPGEVVFISAADSELTLLAGATDRAAYEGLRLANLLRLAHNLSVDLWLEKTVRHASLVVVRLLGGPSYWQYGVDELTALALAGRFRLVLLPGDSHPDPQLAARSGIGQADWQALHALFTAGGPDNADRLLQGFRALAAGEPWLRTEPRPMPRFGIWSAERGLGLDPPATAGPVVPILFYRSLLEGGGTATLEALVAEVEAHGLTPLPCAVSSLREPAAVAFLKQVMARQAPAVILNLTGFALGVDGLAPEDNPFAAVDAPVIQLLQGGRAEAQWRGDSQGLGAKDLAMQVVLPELDGRHGMLLVGHKEQSLWHARTQCPLSAYAPYPAGIARAVRLAANWAKLRATPRPERRLALVLANYPLRDGRLANGVGYDAPQSTVEILRALHQQGYGLDAVPQHGNALIALLQQGPTNARPDRGEGVALPLSRYRDLLRTLPLALQEAVTSRWGEPEADPFCRAGLAFHLPVLLSGNVAILLQPGRGHGTDTAGTYHDASLVPPHAYLAAYLWLREVFGAQALIHNGKHGTLEWLPGKAVALDETSYPAALWGELPHLYPFIVNDPGEGSQAKRRAGAVIVDHLVPPLTRADSYGPLKDLEALLDEYYAASGMDRRRLADLGRRILDFARDARLDADIGLVDGDEAESLRRIDTFLCDLKEAQIRDGLHVLGHAPQGRLQRDLLVAIARAPRGERPADASLIRALADDLSLGFDPLTAEPGANWSGPGPWRSVGKVIDHLETLAALLVGGQQPLAGWTRTRAVLEEIDTVIRPRLAASGDSEMRALLDGLDGRFVPPGPAGAPSRGRLDVLPTGRNFYAVDIRAVPTPTAWDLGRRSAESLLARHFQDHGTPLRALALSVWGTANMRTGGDDVAQALALIGVRPVWEPSSLRVSGYEIVPLARLGRPRVDVTLRISGFFRDAFPAQVDLFDRAVRAVGALDEPEDDNPVAARMRADALGLRKAGVDEGIAALRAGHRIFGARPGSYGSGVGALLEDQAWGSAEQLAGAFLDWGHYAYGVNAEGVPARADLALRLAGVEAVVHNQDNREHDLLDSDNYWQFEGGLAAAVTALAGRRPPVYHNDHSRPERPLVRSLEEEVSRVMRARVVNPKWIEGVKRHGYKGAFEIIATLDYMFAFAATTGAVRTHHFDLAFEAFVEDEATRSFLIENNRFGYDELIGRFAAARQRGFWTPRSNSAHALLEREP